MAVYLGDTEVGAIVEQPVSGDIYINKEGKYDVSQYATATVRLGDKLIELTLPEEFADASSVIYEWFNDNIIIVASSKTGVWRYKVNSKEWKKQLTSTGFTSLAKVGDKVLIGGGLGIYIYLPETDTTIASSVPNISIWNMFRVVGTKCFISSSATTNSYSKGIYIYDSLEGTFVRAYTSGYQWGYIQSVGDNCLISSSHSNTSGILLYNSTNNTISLLTSSGFNFQYFQLVNETKCLVSNPKGTTGLWLYKLEDNSFTRIYTSSYWTSFNKVGNNYLITSNYSYYNNSGILLYNSTDDTVEQIYSTGYNWNIFQQVTENKYLISSIISSNLGILLYNSTDNTIEKIYSTGYNWNIFQIIGNDCLISSTTSSGSGVLLYNSTDNTVELKYSAGWKYDTITQDGENFYLESTNKYDNRRILYYNITDKSIILIGYYLEVNNGTI